MTNFDQAVEQSQYGDFELNQNPLTKEAFFKKGGDQLDLVVDAYSYFINPNSKFRASNEPVLGIAGASEVEDRDIYMNCEAQIFSKYVDQTDKIRARQYNPEIDKDLQRLSHSEFWNKVKTGEITDARLITAAFKLELQDKLLIDEQTSQRVTTKLAQKSEEVAQKVYGLKDNMPTEGVAIDKNKWMSTKVNASNEHFYATTNSEVLVMATSGKLFKDGRINYETSFWINFELLPAQGKVCAIVPGGGVEQFTSDKPFTTRNINENGEPIIDEELKTHINRKLSEFGDTKLASAFLELAQETPFKDGRITKIGKVHAGLNTTDATSELFLVERAEFDNEFGRVSADEPFELKGAEVTLKELIYAIDLGLIQDTRIIAFVAKLLRCVDSGIVLEG